VDAAGGDPGHLEQPGFAARNGAVCQPPRHPHRQAALGLVLPVAAASGVRKPRTAPASWNSWLPLASRLTGGGPVDEGDPASDVGEICSWKAAQGGTGSENASHGAAVWRLGHSC
jgi:hypothetical protein